MQAIPIQETSCTAKVAAGRPAARTVSRGLSEGDRSHSLGTAGPARPGLETLAARRRGSLRPGSGTICQKTPLIAQSRRPPALGGFWTKSTSAMRDSSSGGRSPRHSLGWNDNRNRTPPIYDKHSTSTRGRSVETNAVQIHVQPVGGDPLPRGRWPARMNVGSPTKLVLKRPKRRDGPRDLPVPRGFSFAVRDTLEARFGPPETANSSAGGPQQP